METARTSVLAGRTQQGLSPGFPSAAELFSRAEHLQTLLWSGLLASTFLTPSQVWFLLQAVSPRCPWRGLEGERGRTDPTHLPIAGQHLPSFPHMASLSKLDPSPRSCLLWLLTSEELPPFTTKRRRSSPYPALRVLPCEPALATTNCPTRGRERGPAGAIWEQAGLFPPVALNLGIKHERAAAAGCRALSWKIM